MWQRTFPPASLAGILACGLAAGTPTLAAGQAAPKTAAEKIQNAMTAAPGEISAKATLRDWPASAGAASVVLREGSNGWVCYPDMPMTKGNDPMCLDATWQAWLTAYMTKQPPRLSGLGVGYMIAPGGAWGSNTDPYAEKETADNEWGYDPPHVMLLVPDPAVLAALPVDRKSGGAWVMWRGTPYVHVMIPLSAMTPGVGKP